MGTAISAFPATTTVAPTDRVPVLKDLGGGTFGDYYVTIGNLYAASSSQFDAGRPGARMAFRASAAALPAYAYANGTAGVGATITGNVNGALSLDGSAVVTTDGQGYPYRVFIQPAHCTNAAHGGLYTVTTVGDAGTKFVLTRATDFDSAAHMTARFFIVGSGSTLASTTWTFDVPGGGITVGTTALVFNQYTALSPFCLSPAGKQMMLGLYMGSPGAGYPASVGYPNYTGRWDFNAQNGDYAIVVSGPQSTSPSFGMKCSAGIVSSDECMKWLNYSEVNFNGDICGDGSWIIGGTNNGTSVPSGATARGLGYGDMAGNWNIRGTTVPVNGGYKSALSGGSSALAANGLRCFELVYTDATHQYAVLSTGGSNTQNFQIGPDAIYELTATLPTTATAANATWVTSGSYKQLCLFTSSLKFKTGIEPYAPEYYRKLLDLEPIWYRTKGTVDRKDWSFYGLGAEDVARIDPRLVHWSAKQIGEKTVEYEVPVTEKQMAETIVLRDGKHVLTTQEHEIQVYDDLPLHDENGNPIIDKIKLRRPDGKPMLDDNGQQEIALVPRMHRVQRTRTEIRTVPVYHDTEQEPGGVQYPVLTAGLLCLARDQEKTITTQAAAIADLLKRVTALEKRRP